MDAARNGTCYTSTECQNKGGTKSGNCAAGQVQTFYLHIYSNLHICPSLRHLLSSIHSVPSHFIILAVRRQNVMNKSCLVCVKSEKYAVWVTLRPLESMRKDKAQLCKLRYQGSCSQILIRGVFLGLNLLCLVFLIFQFFQVLAFA